ncbi:MAG: CpaF/VirB11 family protein [Erysipelotrichaceae bacterium]
MGSYLEFNYDEIDWGKKIEALLKIDTVTDINVRNNELWVNDIKKGHYKIKDVSKTEIMEVANRLGNNIANRMNNNFNLGAPILDGNSGVIRVNAIHSSLTEKYNAIAIRKTPINLRLTEKYIIDSNYATKKIMEILKQLVIAKANIVICGITGSGKTELLKYLSKDILDNESIITIEDTWESHLKDIYPKKDILALKSNDEANFSDLIKASLRQNPDRIFVSESRGKEVLDLLNSMSTGHNIITTIHTSSADEIPTRMIEMAGANQDEEKLKKRIHRYVDIGIFINITQNKHGIERKIFEVVEFSYEDDKYIVNTIYEYDFINKEDKYNDFVSNKLIRKLSLVKELT